MTAQIPDRLIHHGKTLSLCTTPLDAYLARLPKNRRPKFAVTCSVNWRGYIATWEFIDRSLYLVDIEGLVSDESGSLHDATLARCFPHRERPILATWVTANLRSPEGRLRNYVHYNFLSQYERDRIFLVQNGNLHEEWLVFNPPPALNYRIEPDGSRTYFNFFCGREEERAPDPFGPDEPIQPWLLWGRPDWDIERDDGGDEGYVIGALTTFPPRARDERPT